MLKKYQQNTLDALTKYLQLCAVYKDVKKAYSESTKENFGAEGLYNDAGFTNIPYLCLRLPTGGGKTLLASHSIPIVCKEYLSRDFSLVIWLVPSNAILEQTYNCLIDNNHPYRRVLDDSFNGNIEILRIDEARNVSKGSLQSNTVVIISTFASWRVNDKEGRKVYEQNGSLSSHFEFLKQEQLEKLDKLNDSNVPVHSLANVVYLNNPIFIIDEAHNARTELTFEVLKRLNPSCLIEFTATPKTKGNDRSNVLYSVSAAELKAESMIKMPIELLTTIDWQTTIADAVKKQGKLEEIAKQEESITGEYIRPIVLIQAQHDSKTESTINVDEVKNFLLNTLRVPNEYIAVATGTERGIEGIDLLSSEEQIRFIITKQALKEGWDCPFAYIFSSVAKVSSSKDVEQLLGRVLRMPKVQRKENEALNRAYAFVSSNSFYQTAINLRDSLVKAGFTSEEVSDLIEVSPQQMELGTFFGNIRIQVSNKLDESKLSNEIKKKIEYVSEEKAIVLKSEITETEKEEIKNALKSDEDKAKVDIIYDEMIRDSKQKLPPSKQGKVFKLPQLYIDFEGEKRIFDEEVLLPLDWNLAKCDYSLSEFEFPFKVEAGQRGLIDIDSKGKAITYAPSAIQEELKSLIVSSTMDKDGLIQWLVKESRHQSIPYAQTIVFISNLVDDLISSRNLQVEHLVFMRFRLKSAVREKIKQHYLDAKKKGFQELLFTEHGVVKEKLSKFSLGEDFVFPETYPVSNPYSGTFRFSKHYYSQIGEMNDEEEECAINIDSNPNVEFWVRNIERREFHSFWLQTSTDKFYPDFVVKLKDGTIVLVEYKNETLYSTDDSKEKRQIGKFYAGLSNGSCRFLMLNGKDWNLLKSLLSIEKPTYK